MVVCATASVVIGSVAGQRRDVLALSRAVPTGHVLTSQDLRSVPVAVDADVPLVAAGGAASVLGRTVTTGLPAGTLLSAGMVGGSLPPPGRAISALALKPGQFPPELGPGMHVDVVVVPTQQAGTGQVAVPGSWPAVVLGVAAGENGQASVVSLDLDARDAARVAVAGAGAVSLVVVARG